MKTHKTESNPEGDNRLVLSRKEAAEALRISERKLWSMTASGDIPHLKVGRRVVYPKLQLMQWIADRVRKARMG
ncbi:MAG: helix-turn-helix domain-containing protein [Phycisphaeraceae bacterium]